MSFNKAFNLCFYKDFRKISKQDFWDKLLKDKESKIDIKLDKKKYEEYTNTLFTKNKYFKLILYMFYYNN